jgi:hypothetical protein
MPDEAREIIFPEGVPLISRYQFSELHPQERLNEMTPSEQHPTSTSSSPESVSNVAEGSLRNEDEDIQELAQQSRSPAEGKNLLDERELAFLPRTGKPLLKIPVQPDELGPFFNQESYRKIALFYRNNSPKMA